MTARQQARAKINLSLHVTGKRSDGYHLLESLIVFADVGDVLTARPADDLSLEITGPFAAGLEADAGNLVLKAVSALRDKGQGASIHLVKNLPLSAGLGGGSSDAAATLRLLQTLWDKRLERSQLMEMATGLGADVPVCLEQKPSIMRGIGEDITHLHSFPAIPAVLVNPGIEVPTQEVFNRLGQIRAKPDDIPIAFQSPEAVVSWLKTTRNDLEAPAISIAPAISDVLKILGSTTDCQLARMTGSGATCFGFFDSAKAASKAAAQISATHPDWWCVPVEIKSV